MKTLALVEDFIFQSPAWKLVTVILLVMLFRTGLWYIPNLGASLAIVQNPFINPFENPNAHYLYWSWLGPFVAWLVGAKSKSTFFLLYLAFSVAFTALFIGLVFSRFSDRTARVSLVLFSVLPVSATAYFWVSLDSLTLFLMLIALARPGNFPITFLAGLCLGMQHFEQAFFGAGGLLLALLLSKRQGDTFQCPARSALILLIGIAAGKVALIGIFSYFGVHVNSGRMYYLGEHLSTVLGNFFFHFHQVVWSVLGLGWLVALKFADIGKRSIPFFVALFGLMLLLPFSADQTRVLAVGTFLTIAVYWLLNEDFLKQITNRQVAVIFLLWVLMPWSWVWQGVPKWSVFPYDVAYVLHRTLGWFNVPTDPAIWPF